MKMVITVVTLSIVFARGRVATGLACGLRRAGDSCHCTGNARNDTLSLVLRGPIVNCNCNGITCGSICGGHIVSCPR